MADWEYPGLGFDPLPGNPQVAQDLERDARVFGQRMTEQATELNRLACKGEWAGEAAEVFKEHLRTLPRDLERCGEAFTGLANALVKYAGLYDVAKRTTVAGLERRAVEARNKLQLADMAFHTPTIGAPGDCPPPPDRKPLDDAHDTLGAILREAHDYAEKFNDTAEIRDLERIIRHTLTEYAPDQPRWNILKHWAGNVFKLAAASSPIGLAVLAAHELINQYPEFFNHLAGFLSELSGVIGLLALPAMFFPPLGTAMGVTILGLTAASAGIKTSLYVGDARDANGNLIVNGWSLARSYFDVALSAGAVATVAGVERAGVLAGGDTTTFGEQVSRQFSKEAYKEDSREWTKHSFDLLDRVGKKATAKQLFKEGLEPFAKGSPGRALNWGGLAVGAAAPAGTGLDPSNLFGWKAVRHIKPETMELLKRGPESPNLQVKTGPVMRAANQPTFRSPDPEPPPPVMGR